MGGPLAIRLVLHTTVVLFFVLLLFSGFFRHSRASDNVPTLFNDNPDFDPVDFARRVQQMENVVLATEGFNWHETKCRPWKGKCKSKCGANGIGAFAKQGSATGSREHCYEEYLKSVESLTGAEVGYCTPLGYGGSKCRVDDLLQLAEANGNEAAVGYVSYLLQVFNEIKALTTAKVSTFALHLKSLGLTEIGVSNSGPYVRGNADAGGGNNRFRIGYRVDGDGFKIPNPNPNPKKRI